MCSDQAFHSPRKPRCRRAPPSDRLPQLPSPADSRLPRRTVLEISSGCAVHVRQPNLAGLPSPRFARSTLDLATPSFAATDSRSCDQHRIYTRLLQSPWLLGKRTTWLDAKQRGAAFRRFWLTPVKALSWPIPWDRAQARKRRRGQVRPLSLDLSSPLGSGSLLLAFARIRHGDHRNVSSSFAGRTLCLNE